MRIKFIEIMDFWVKFLHSSSGIISRIENSFRKTNQFFINFNSNVCLQCQSLWLFSNTLPSYLEAEEMGRAGNCSMYLQMCPHSMFSGFHDEQEQNHCKPSYSGNAYTDSECPS